MPSNPLTKALAYPRERRLDLEIFFTDPDVPMDTNYVSAGRDSLGSPRLTVFLNGTGRQVAGMVQSLILTWRLHDVDPYTYLIDVLQRVGQQPAARAAELTPRLWRHHFAANPRDRTCTASASRQVKQGSKNCIGVDHPASRVREGRTPRGYHTHSRIAAVKAILYPALQIDPDA